MPPALIPSPPSAQVVDIIGRTVTTDTIKAGTMTGNLIGQNITYELATGNLCHCNLLSASVYVSFPNLPIANNDLAASLLGVNIGGVYRDNSTPAVLHVRTI
jgi:hypothetical protein